MFAGHKLIFCVCRDITERKQAEEALRRTEQNFRDSLENSPLGIRIIDIVGKTLYANRPLLDMWGYNSIEELEAVPRKQRYTPQSYTEHMERAGKGRGGNVPLDYEVSIVRSDGQVRHLAAYTRALLWNGERQFQVVYQDVTERKKVEQELQDERMKLKEAQAIGKMGNWEYDADSQKIIWSDEVYVLYERDPALGPPTAEEEAKYYSTEQAKKLRDYAARAIKSGEEFKYDIEANLPSGRRAFFAASMRSIKNESGRVIRLFGTVQDITERKRQEEERRQLEQKAQLTSRLASVGEMAAGIAHEINNPLTSVIGYSQLLSGRKDITEDVKADLKAIDEGAQRVAGIIKRLLTFARQSKPERAFVNINDLITNTLDLRAYHLRTNNIKVTTKLATDLPLTTADPAQLQQVFLNIIVNAETAMTQANGRGKLLVKTEEVNGTIRISFKDNGSGIAKKNLERIFDPFFTTREVDQGTGLGLSICHGIIAEHKGKIWAESTLGRGATFMVELPIVTGSIQLEMAEPSGKKPKKMPKARILVVDDEPSTLEFLSRLLADEGHDVETVNNADEALEMVKNRRYSLILLDIKMPGTSGIELYGRMQKIALSLSERVIFITGDVMGTDTESFLSRTKAPFITKPFDVRQLKKKIERFLTGD
jgi:PAS domain S-box-containing protein